MLDLMLLFRISKSPYVKNLAASGLESRWNSKGNFVIYCASSLSLACLETIVHSSGELLYNQDYKSIIINIPEAVLITKIALNTLSANWKEREQRALTQHTGDNWYKKQETLLLQVPSAIIPREANFLINTKHPDFNKVFIDEIDSFMFDKKLKDDRAE